MRQPISLVLFAVCLIAGVVLPASAAAEDENQPKPPKVKAADSHYKVKVYDLGDPKHRDEFNEKLLAGHIHEIVVEKTLGNPMKPDVYVAIATIVVFLGLLLVLRKLAWGPMLEGLKKREESILSAVEEAKKAREETQRVTAEFKAKMDQAYAEIPKIMEEARREAEAFKEETRAQTAKEMQAERQRLRREIDTAKDQALQELWTQAAQLATLISAKVIGRSLPAAEHHRLIDEALVELREAAPRR